MQPRPVRAEQPTAGPAAHLWIALGAKMKMNKPLTLSIFKFCCSYLFVVVSAKTLDEKFCSDTWCCVHMRVYLWLCGWMESWLWKGREMYFMQVSVYTYMYEKSGRLIWVCTPSLHTQPKSYMKLGYKRDMEANVASGNSVQWFFRRATHTHSLSLTHKHTHTDIAGILSKSISLSCHNRYL